MLFVILLFFQSRADVYIGIFPDYTSVKTLSHWSQVCCYESQGLMFPISSTCEGCTTKGLAKGSTLIF